jgi:hypothetical protein
MKAPEHWRNPKRGGKIEHRKIACVLECGGAPPLFLTR